jgi:hypothetical protein
MLPVVWAAAPTAAASPKQKARNFPQRIQASLAPIGGNL